MAETPHGLAAALAAAQGEMPTIPKNKKANYGKYADLATIHEHVLPVLSKHGLAWATMPGNDEAGNDVLFYKLMHTSGEAIEGKMRLRIVQDNMQQLGGAITYAKRYAISAVTGAVTDEDDDGNTSSGREKDGTGSQKTAIPPKKPTPPVEPSRDIYADTHAITGEQVQELVQLAKRKGYATKEEAIAFLNSLNGGESFLEIKQDQFNAFKTAVIQSGWKKGE